MADIEIEIDLPVEPVVEDFPSNAESPLSQEELFESSDSQQTEAELEDSEITTKINLSNVWSAVSSVAINLVLPFINGMMLGFGEILAHEVAFRYKWRGAKIQPPSRMLRAASNSSAAVQSEKSYKEESPAISQRRSLVL
ncbi:Mitochondrial membrane import protein [Komagataella phaffii CBS 7435]|uniref:Mitochondrial outer membrane protein n=2 Tax=Komagataella phaffii TaxID=460519 RepID=C4R4L2_KOMPG|nr:Mitochondrial outer membrane protein [Komagataella phaffii GS115]AOA64068.1 GQ67_03521T0 [Komagataella phaffii]CAH2449740.1 Mitochondrial membrane import protein [Komagataella phaffii CBS 7435]AOA69057.1 GQ68_03491T0 [Komagataella phaffii GS115]CAY70498.1 Mitochondrial outer membrane protein [Komagataella phaffii GS115]CCA39713.1 Mitochondrial membrane import protein [Komagataella phaffii CBS 7435]